MAYLRILRRHWKMIVAATLVGALLGAASTLLNGSDDGPRASYYKATHTLFLDTSVIGDRVRPIYTNLDQIAVLVTTGDVPRRVAGELGGDAGDWSARVFTVTNGSTNTLDVTCAAKDADEAVTCADTFAAELIASLEEREQQRFDSQRDDTIRRLDSLQAQINDLEALIATRPPNLDLVQAQRNSLVNQYRLAYEKFQQLADQGGPVSVVSTLESAEAQRISEAEYKERIQRGQLGQNRVRGDFDPNRALVEVPTSEDDRFSSPWARGALGALLGLMVGIGLAVVTDRADRRLRTREEVEAAFGMAVLAEIPALTAAQQRQSGILSAAAPLSSTAEAYRAVRSSLMFQRATDTRSKTPGEAMVVLISSPGPREGKTTATANLATMFAETGQRVLAVNCDFRRPSLHQLFGLENEPRRVLETDIPRLWVVTDVTSSRASNPAFVVEEQRRLVASARNRFDVILLDTAPMLTTNDATEIMGSADYVVVVCRAGVTTTDAAQRARELLARIDAPVSGVVLVGSEAPPNDYYYYYSRGRAPQRVDAVPEPVAADAPLFPDDAPGTGTPAAP